MPISGDAFGGDFFFIKADIVSFCVTSASGSTSPCVTPPSGSQQVIIKLHDNRELLLKIRSRYLEELAIIAGLPPMPDPSTGSKVVTFGNPNSSLAKLRTKYQETLDIISGLPPTPIPSDGSKVVKLSNVTEEQRERLNKLRDKLNAALSNIKRC